MIHREKNDSLLLNQSLKQQNVIIILSPVKCSVTLSTKEIHMVFKLKFENKVFDDAVRIGRGAYCVVEQGQTC